MSFLPPVLLVVMLFMVKPRVKTSAWDGRAHADETNRPTRA